mmetsp:Transcript_4268/g.6253  ORF Transcript_4268/g.6253 Transcript_4268/m.6253 type:complete len:160 (-) Transcript_4268:139-618(-)
MSDITKNVVITYGALERDAEDGGKPGSYDIDNLRFVPNDNMSPEEKRNKCITITFCLSVFALLIGAIGYMLFSDFGHLYPGSSTHAEKDYPTIVKRITSPPAPVPSSVEEDDEYENIPVKEESSASCSVHQKCTDLGLTNDCCPTSKGIMLGCCDLDLP